MSMEFISSVAYPYITPCRFSFKQCMTFLIYICFNNLCNKLIQLNFNQRHLKICSSLLDCDQLRIGWSAVQSKTIAGKLNSVSFNNLRRFLNFWIQKTDQQIWTFPCSNFKKYGIFIFTNKHYKCIYFPYHDNSQHVTEFCLKHHNVWDLF